MEAIQNKMNTGRIRTLPPIPSRPSAAPQRGSNIPAQGKARRSGAEAEPPPWVMRKKQPPPAMRSERMGGGKGGGFFVHGLGQRPDAPMNTSAWSFEGPPCNRNVMFRPFRLDATRSNSPQGTNL
jgi:hypothetical protein